MAGVQEFSQARENLGEIVQSGDAALVIGAGASVSSGAPITATLVEELRSEFPLAGITETASLFDAGNAVCFTPAYGRQRLVRFVADRFNSLEPSDAYKQLPRAAWRALFTTNYDDLIELAYRTPARCQSIQPITLSNLNFTVGRLEHVFLIYLMGTIRAQYDDEGSPVLSWGDYHRSVIQRAPALSAINGILANDGRVVYVGYSFNDFLLEGVLDVAHLQIQPRNLPYGYAILRDWPEQDEQPLHRMTSRNIIPVKGTFEDFADLIKDIADGNFGARSPSPTPVASPAKGKTLTIGGAQVQLAETDVAVYSEMVHLLDDSVKRGENDSAAAVIDKKKRFLRGESVGWAPFKEGWAFRRAAYKTALDEVVRRCKEAKPANHVLLVHGPAALGKSIMAKQLAFDIYVKQRLPVLVVKSNWRARPDMTLLNRICDDLENSLPLEHGLPPILIIIDEAELLDRSVPSRLSGYLKSHGRRAVIVLFARTNEYYREGGSREADAIPNLSDIALDDKLEQTELDDFIKHIVAMRVWEKEKVSDVRFWREHITKELDSSFFDAVYSIVELTQEPLRDHVRSEFQRLGDTAKQAYGLIAATHQFGIPLKMEVLTRALGVTYGDFERQVIRSDAENVLFADTQSNLNILFRGRTRIISQTVFDYAFEERKAQLEVFKAVVKATNPSEMFGVDELDALRTLLVQVLGPKGFDNRFSPDEQSELLNAATQQLDDDVLEHHLGLAERNAGRLMSALKHLERALDLRHVLPEDLSMLRESPQNIENSLAQVKGALANEAIKRGDHEKADALFEEARRHFVNARVGHFPNPAAYDAHAKMLRERALRLFKPGTMERTVALADALQVVNEGIDNLNNDGKLTLIQLRVELMDQLGFDEDAIDQLKRAAETGPNKARASYYVVLAGFYVSRRSGGAKGKDYNKAHPFAVKACELDPESFPAWRLRAEIYAALQPSDWRGLMEILEKAQAKAVDQDNCWVSYQLAVVAFHCDKYDTSATTFRHLNRISRGHESRVGVLDVAGERGGGDAFEYSGKVVQSGAARRNFRIRCADLDAFGDIYFNPRGQELYTPRRGDTVTFLVGFNYRGIVAMDLRRA